jgi:hypothetical protein
MMIDSSGAAYSDLDAAAEDVKDSKPQEDIII